MRHILIGGAWPYANSPLHAGHIASLLPGDVLARYFRAAGDQVIYVSGSDCHGTPITLHARREGRTSREVSDDYHLQFAQTFRRLGFSYDLYSKTSHPQHVQFVQAFHKKLYASPHIHESGAVTARCARCEAWLSDREVKGYCPSCGAATHGDQCPTCGRMLEAESLLDPTCAACGTAVERVPSTQLFLRMKDLEGPLRTYFDAHPDWRRSVRELSGRLLSDGIPDLALTRPMDWGISVPREGYDDRRIYLWAENVLGYYSAAEKVCDANLWNFGDFSGPDALHYYVHGRTNIPYHTLMLPALLMAHGEGWHLPDQIVASAHMLYEGRTISGRDGAPSVTADGLLTEFAPDVIRYYLLSCGVEKKDTVYAPEQLIERSDRELSGIYGNFVHRTLAFISRHLHGEVPFGDIEPAVRRRVEETFESVGRKIEAAQLRAALEEVMNLARLANRYFDAREPWKTRGSHPGRCQATLANCLWLCANLCVLFAPFLPDSSAALAAALGISTARWACTAPACERIGEPAPLFPR